MATDLFDLSGRVAAVTGGSRGLGREMVLAFAERGQPHEIIGTALHLASDASSYTTGAVVAVDGGPR